MKYLYCLLLFAAFHTAMAQSIRLAPPQTPALRLTAGKGKTVAFELRQSGSVLRYTTDGSIPSEKSAVYNAPIPADQPGTIRCVAFQPGFLPSAPQSVELLPADKKALRVQVVPAPAPAYSARGAASLQDDVFGNFSFGQHWLGFNDSLVEIDLTWKRKTRLNTLSISMLRAQNAWIFLPEKIQVYNETGQLVAEKNLSDSGISAPDKLEFLGINIPRKKYRSLKIRFIPLKRIPEWHSGKGSTPWLFVDEVLGS